MAAPTHAEQIAAKEAELAAARKALVDNFERPIGGSSRTKQFGRRVDAQLRRAGQLRTAVLRLERELEGLRRDNLRPEVTPVDLSKLPAARYVRTEFGWHKVVKVNKATVKVRVEPGWNDLIKVSKILEIR